jgi:protein CpxP
MIHIRTAISKFSQYFHNCYKLFAIFIGKVDIENGDNPFDPPLINERLKMNKKIVILALALALPLTVAAFPGGGFEGHRGDRLERMTKNLDLTAEQKGKLEVIFKEQQEKFEAIHQETRSRMQKVLSAEQMAKLDELKKLHQEKWQKRHEEWKNKKQSETQK